MSICRSGIVALILTLTVVGAGFGFAARAADDDAKADASSSFIYLDDGSETAELPPLFPDDTQRSPEEILADRDGGKAPFYILDGGPAGLISPALRSESAFGTAEQRASFQLGYGQLEPGTLTPAGLGVWLSSEVMVQAPPRFGALGTLDEYTTGLDHRSYNLGLGVGYDGFSLGASLRREHGDFELGYRGFDLGLAYQGRSWFTNIQYAGYRNEQGPLFYSFLSERKLQAFEIGAGYALWPGLTFSGRFKYFDYSNPLFPETAPDREHVFSLGTKLNF